MTVEREEGEGKQREREEEKVTTQQNRTEQLKPL